MESPPPPKTQSLTRKLPGLAEGGQTSHQGTAARSMSWRPRNPGTWPQVSTWAGTEQDVPGWQRKCLLKWKGILLVQWTPVSLPYRFINCEHLPFFPLSHTYTSVLLLFGFFFFFFAELLWSKLQTCNSLSLNTSASIFFFFFKISWCGPILKTLLNLLQHYICLMFWIFGPEARGILGPWPGIEPPPFALEGKIWTTGPSGKSQQGSFKSKDLLWLNHIAMSIFRKCDSWTLLCNTGSILRCLSPSDVGSQATVSCPVLSVHLNLGWFLAFLYHSRHWLLKQGCRPTVVQNVLLCLQNIPQFKLCIFVIPSKYYTGSPSLKYFIIFQYIQN